MELTATNDLGRERTFENVVALKRLDGDLLVQIDSGGSNKWERVIDGRVELFE